MKIIVTNGRQTDYLKKSDEIEIPMQELHNVEDSVCTSLDLFDCMDYVDYSKRVDLLSLATSKIRHNGLINISGSDISCVATYVYNGLLNIEGANKQLFKGKSSSDMATNIESKLQEMGFTIEYVKILSSRYNIQAKRN